jgi:hypothetical protein
MSDIPQSALARFRSHVEAKKGNGVAHLRDAGIPHRSPRIAPLGARGLTKGDPWVDQLKNVLDTAPNAGTGNRPGR